MAVRCAVRCCATAVVSHACSGQLRLALLLQRGRGESVGGRYQLALHTGVRAWAPEQRRSWPGFAPRWPGVSGRRPRSRSLGGQQRGVGDPGVLLAPARQCTRRCCQRPGWVRPGPRLLRCPSPPEGQGAGGRGKGRARRRLAVQGGDLTAVVASAVAWCSGVPAPRQESECILPERACAAARAHQRKNAACNRSAC